jgi:hypothetical protein
LESFYKWSDAELERLRIKHSDNPHLLELADFYVSLNSQDKAGLRVLREEMDLAAEMSKLPSAKRSAFFDQKIRPLEQKEDQLSEREVEMARDAKKRGLALPPWLSEIRRCEVILFRTSLNGHLSQGLTNEFLFPIVFIESEAGNINDCRFPL